MKKYIELIFLIVLVLILISGCTQSSFTGYTTKKLENNKQIIKGCPYSDGSTCKQSCCKTGNDCEDLSYSYRICDILRGVWDKKKYKDPHCKIPCVVTRSEKKETPKEEEEEPEEKKVPICSSGWKCKDLNYRGYQNSDCSWSGINYCEYECNGGTCSPPPCSETYLSEKRCLDNWVQQKYQYENCDTKWIKIEYCEYGCENGKCKTQTQICVPNEKRCFENDLQQCSFDGLNWQTIQTCEYRCENNQCIEEPTDQIIVSRVIDGDTVELNSGDKVRLIGINTPEEDQYYYSEAKNKLKELVEEKIVTLEKDISDKDIYDRLLRYIYVNDLFVNLEMVRLGYAEAYEYPPDTKYSSLLKEAENEAKENELGIWGTSEYKDCFIVSDFHYDAEGNDNYNLNDEYVTFGNICSYSIDMTSWTVKDETASHIYTFSSFVFQAEETFTLYTGTGANTNSELYWGRASGNYAAIWNNDGDTLFLRDKEGGLVLSYSY